MTTFPGLEAALDAAAHSHYEGRRRHRVPWPAGAALALALAAALVVLVLVLAPAREGQVAGEPPVTVPDRTLALSHALTAAPARVSGAAVEHAQLPAVAAELARAVPYPPGSSDSFDWSATAPGPYDMSSFNFRGDVQSVVEYRAACLWLGFWGSAYDAGNVAALSAATAVLADVPAWPAFRGPAGDQSQHWRALSASAAAHDAAPLRAEAALNCRGVR